jgi:5-methylcytosine-specific restriction endonuclease McrA
MRPEEREVLRRRFDFRCGYCGVSENDVGAELTVDHYHPRSRNGPDEPANWVYSCFACNTHKGGLITGIFPFVLFRLEGQCSARQDEAT